MTTARKIIRIATITVITATVIVAIYIMANGLGLVDSLDFGAGAYYYADIPDYEKIDNGSVFQTSVPRWIHIVLFLTWGWLMFRLWKWIDKKANTQ